MIIESYILETCYRILAFLILAVIGDGRNSVERSEYIVAREEPADIAHRHQTENVLIG